MRLSLLLALILASPIVPAARAAQEEVVPSPLPPARYAQLREKSPFALATPDEAPKVAEKTFADGWKIKGLTRYTDEGKSIDLVAIASADARESFSLESDKERQGVVIASINWSPDAGKSKVTLKKGTEYAILEYDQMDSQPPPGVVAAVPGRNGQSPFPPQQLQGRQNGSGVMGAPQMINSQLNRSILPRATTGPQIPSQRPVNGQPGGLQLPGVPNAPGATAGPHRPVTRYISSP